MSDGCPAILYGAFTVFFTFPDDRRFEGMCRLNLHGRKPRNRLLANCQRFFSLADFFLPWRWRWHFPTKYRFLEDPHAPHPRRRLWKPQILFLIRHFKIKACIYNIYNAHTYTRTHSTVFNAAVQIVGWTTTGSCFHVNSTTSFGHAGPSSGIHDISRKLLYCVIV
jgi:hypothetical protein